MSGIDFFDPWSVEVRGRPMGWVGAEETAHERLADATAPKPAIPATGLERVIDATTLESFAAPSPAPAPTRATRSHWSAREARSGAPFPSAVLNSAARSPDEAVGPDGAPGAPDAATEPVAMLRKVLVPEILAISARLESAKHRTALQDLLDLEEPALRMLVWPSPGLLVPPGPRLQATIEFTVELGDSGSVVVRHWFGPGGGESIVQARLPLPELDHFRVRAEILDFLKKVLDRA